MFGDRIPDLLSAWALQLVDLHHGSADQSLHAPSQCGCHARDAEVLDDRLQVMGSDSDRGCGKVSIR